MATTFTKGSEFASYFFHAAGRSYIIRSNRCLKTLEVLTRTAREITRLINARELDAAYDQAAYGLLWVIESGRANSYVYHAITSMKTRPLCQLIHELKAYSHDIGLYGRYLNEKYTPAPAEPATPTQPEQAAEPEPAAAPAEPEPAAPTQEPAAVPAEPEPAAPTQEPAAAPAEPEPEPEPEPAAPIESPPDDLIQIMPEYTDINGIVHAALWKPRPIIPYKKRFHQQRWDDLPEFQPAEQKPLF